MRKLFTTIVSILLLSSGIVLAAPANENKDDKKTEQKTEKKSDKKEEKKDEKKEDDSKGKPHQPINLVYEFAWPWIMR